MTPDTLIEAVRYFSDLEICNDYMRKIKWPDGKPVCPHCGAVGDRLRELATRPIIRCKDCRKDISYKVGTIFEGSPLGLDKWFVAVWSIANCKNGIASHELGRALGVTQKTAWFMLHRIRKAMEIDDAGKFDGPAEADTTYVGGRAANMHKGKRAKVVKGRGSAHMTPVHGILQRADADRASRMRCTVLVQQDAETLIAEIKRHVQSESTIYTDAAPAYDGLIDSYTHDAIDHSIEYVRDAVHTNGCENFWSLLKRGIKGTYVAIAPFHLFRYVAEQVFRFNNRKETDGWRFASLMGRVTGKRLTYRVLCGFEGAGFMGLE